MSGKFNILGLSICNVCCVKFAEFCLLLMSSKHWRNGIQTDDGCRQDLVFHFPGKFYSPSSYSTIFYNLSLQNLLISFRKSSELFWFSKKENPCLIARYRPISVLNNISQALEIDLDETFHNHIRHMLNERQYVFWRCWSTTTIFFACLSSFHQFGTNTQVNVNYNNISDVFDELDYLLLFGKLVNLLFDYKLCTILERNLYNRSQYVDMVLSLENLLYRWAISTKHILEACCSTSSAMILWNIYMTVAWLTTWSYILK